MAKLFNLARVTTATTGTGTITLSTAVSGYLTFASAGVADGDYVSYGIKDGANSEAGFGKYTSSGTTLTRNPVTSTNGNAAISLSGTAEVYVTSLKADFPFPDNWLSGLTLVNNGTTSLDLSVGVAADTLNVEIMRLTSTLTKSTSAWAVGSASGGLDTGSIAASTWYHVWLIRRPDTGVVDGLFSTSATAPTMPTNYAQKRRIGSFRTDGSSNIIAFSQNGDEFLWTTQVSDLDASGSMGTSAILQTLTVPTGIKVYALFFIIFIEASASAAATNIIVSSPDETDAAPTTTNFDIYLPPSTPGQLASSVMARIRTNTSAQVRFRLDRSAALLLGYVRTKGWFDRRGKSG